MFYDQSDIATIHKVLGYDKKDVSCSCQKMIGLFTIGIYILHSIYKLVF